MRAAVYLSLLLAPISALAGIQLSSTNNVAREAIPMKPIVGRSADRIVARSPRPDDDDDDDDDDGIVDHIQDVGDDIKDGIHDIFHDDEDAGANVRPEMVTIGFLVTVAVAMMV